ncbi:cation channel sperm-associated protein 2-like isoform X2 [Limulus polyphemus]|nr:cation channel sperm-associated protein 2-like isoform X2 [Limulus polyphemus]
MCAELEENTNAKVQWFCEILNGFDCICLSLFFIEIILKWLEGFRTFWKNGWNIFDFLVTFTTFIPEIILLVLQNKKYSSVQKLVEVMQVFRVVRALKIVMHVEQVRLIALAITKAFKEMTFIAMMLLTVMYIYAIVGVVMFGKYSNINVEKVDSEENFKNLSQAAATLFQLFTLDHWLKVFSDIYSLIGTWFSIIYIISWILIGSFIFRNIFVGILVNNFQSIRTELVQEVEQCLVKSSLADECQTEVEELVTKSGLYNPTSSHTKFQKDKQADDETRRESVYYDFSEEELSIDEEEYEDAMEDQSDQKNTEEKPQLISSRAGTPELNQ